MARQHSHADTPAGSGGSPVAKFLVVMSGPVLAGLVPIAILPALPRMGEHFSAGQTGAFMAQLIATLPALVILLSAPFTETCVRHLGKKRSLLIALLVFAVSGTAGLYVDHLSVLIATRVVLGIATSIIFTLYLTLAGDYYSGDARNRVLGMAVSASLITTIIELSLGGWLVDNYGWRAPFAFYAFSLVVFLIALTGLPRDEASSQADVVPDWDPKLALSLWPELLLFLALAIGIFILSVQGPFLLSEKNINSATLQGTILSGWSITAAISAALFGWCRKSLGDSRLIMLISIGLGVGLVSIALAREIWLVVLACLLVGLAKGLVSPAMTALLLDRTLPSMRVRISAIIVSTMFLGQFLTSLVVNGLQYVLHSLEAAIVVAGVLVAVLGALIAYWRISHITKPAMGETDVAEVKPEGDSQIASQTSA